MDGRGRIRAALATPPGEVRRVWTEHVNPVFVRALELFGFGRDFVRAEGSSLWDAEGREYVDFLAGYGACSLGHNHPAVRAALEEVLSRPLPHFLLVSPQPLAAELARRLAALAPGDLDVCWLGSTGSEAVEGALKLARAATRRPRFVSAANSYHGTTLGALSVSGSTRHRAGFEPLLGGCAIVPWGEVEPIERELRRRDVAAVILEPLQGEGGIRLAPSGYLREVSSLCRRYGALLVLDEVQTGLGRCGALFACQAEGVEPDALLLGKGLSGGMAPVSALLTRRRIWERAYGTLDRYDLHCSTFSGGPLACAAALATLDVLEHERLPQRAAELGRELGARLGAVTRDKPIVREVRGRGLLWGIELAAPTAGVTADLLGQWLVVGLLERGVLTQVCAETPQVVRVQPALNVGAEAVARFGDALEATLADHAAGVAGSIAKAAGRAVQSTIARALTHVAGGDA